MPHTDRVLRLEVMAKVQYGSRDSYDIMHSKQGDTTLKKNEVQAGWRLGWAILFEGRDDDKKPMSDFITWL